MAEANGFVGAGDVYIERIIAGVGQGLKGPYYANKFEIKTNVEKKELVSKGKEDYGNVLESTQVQKPADFSIELNQVNKESMALALLGTSSTVSQSAAALTAADIVAKLDSWVYVGKEALTGTANGTLILTNSAASTTYVEGTHYLVNRDLGLIKALSTGTITEAQALKLTTPYGAVSATKIAGGTNVELRARMLFDGKNLAGGKLCKVECWEAVVSSDNGFDFLADDFNKVPLTGQLKVPTGKTNPFEVTLRD